MMKPSRQANNYNDTVDALIASMLLEVYSKMDQEKALNPNIEQRVAAARALHDTVRKHIRFLRVDNYIDREQFERTKDLDGYLQHQEKYTFMRFAEQLYKENCYRSESFKSVFDYRIKYVLPVFDFTLLEKEG